MRVRRAIAVCSFSLASERIHKSTIGRACVMGVPGKCTLGTPLGWAAVERLPGRDRYHRTTSGKQPREGCTLPAGLEWRWVTA